MSKYSFTFRSLTQAQYARVILSRYGIAGELVQAPTEATENGCAYAVTVRMVDGYRAMQILKQEGISYTRFYQASGRGDGVAL